MPRSKQTHFGFEPYVQKLIAICVGRNVAQYLPGLAARMLQERVDFVYVDHQSEDESHALACQLLGKGISRVQSMPWHGHFSMRQVMEQKQTIARASNAQWVLHIDADEIIEARDPTMGLLDLIIRAEAAQANVINFNEFVFLPQPGQSHGGDRFAIHMDRYYHFAPMPNRLMRLYRNLPDLYNVQSAGHQVTGMVRLYPENQNLRHYIGLSQSALITKYTTRVFDPQELRKGWHHQRVGLQASDLKLPGHDDPRLFRTQTPGDRNLRVDRPLSTHYWQWQARCNQTSNRSPAPV